MGTVALYLEWNYQSVRLTVYLTRSAEITNAWSYTFTPPYFLMAR